MGREEDVAVVSQTGTEVVKAMGRARVCENCLLLLQTAVNKLVSFNSRNCCCTSEVGSKHEDAYSCSAHTLAACGDTPAERGEIGLLCD